MQSFSESTGLKERLLWFPLRRELLPTVQLKSQMLVKQTHLYRSFSLFPAWPGRACPAPDLTNYPLIPFRRPSSVTNHSSPSSPPMFVRHPHPLHHLKS